MALPMLVQRRERPPPLTQPRGTRHPAARFSAHPDGSYPAAPPAIARSRASPEYSQFLRAGPKHDSDMPSLNRSGFKRLAGG
jgi:hypothetical protein